MTNNLKSISVCEVCNNSDLVSVLNLGLNPLCDDLVPVGNQHVCAEYPIDILFCPKCKTAHQKFQVEKKELFPSSYHYRSRFTGDVLNGLRGLVDSYSNNFDDVKGKTVLDIGCNDGSLLSIFREQGANTIGIEPTGAYSDAVNNGHVIYNDFLSPELAKKISKDFSYIDIITFTNVFAHIDNLPEVLESLKILLKPKTKIIIENHYLGSVLDGNQFDTFYHEHPRTYSLSSFVYIAKSMGLSIVNVEFPNRYGGNIRVTLGNDAVDDSIADKISSIIKIESEFLDSFVKLNNNIKKWKSNKVSLIKSLKAKYGKINAKAFPGRAAILIKSLNIDENDFAKVYEKPGSMKIGHYVPGTKIPIVSDEELFSQGGNSMPIINLAWHISDEIKNYLANNGFNDEVVDIISLEDFKA